MRIPYKIGTLLLYIFVMVLGIVTILSPCLSLASAAGESINGYDYMKEWPIEFPDDASKIVGTVTYVFLLLMPIFGGLMIAGGLAGVIVTVVTMFSVSKPASSRIGTMNLARIANGASFSLSGILMGVYLFFGLSTFAAIYEEFKGKENVATAAFVPLILLVVIAIAAIVIHALTQNEADFCGVGDVAEQSKTARSAPDANCIEVGELPAKETRVCAPAPRANAHVAAPQVAQKAPFNFASEKERADLLIEYKKLLDEGILSQEEFANKKAELLAIK